MLDDTNTASLIVILGLSVVLVMVCLFTVFAVLERDQALMELDIATRELHETRRLIAEELNRIDQAYGELDRMPSPIPEFKTQSF